MIRYIWISILFLFVLTACQPDTENQTLDESSNPNDISVEAEEPMSESKEQSVSLEGKLVPPNFSITHFEMKYLKDERLLLFNMNYEFDSEIYDILTDGNQEMHFILEYPESIIDILDQSHSDVLIAEKPSDYNTKYRVIFIEEIELTEDELEKIEDNISNFNLLIADRERDIIAQFIDLYGFNQYDPEKLNNTSLD
ncbi:hypothetical protein KQI76_05235 [Amphibacillus sp. MSJ-3]|uniref:hypothetical protein n=1 Tax=Amphibacillus sp. MSJ-3 TaxID=2841505 RepID=UPI001C0E96FD|nr:hypothetical protein [Amphibacillus sp. MSJ-3]MBU5594561.1 hypothetical protein [Amphibacillus sp. MSJ-3]